MIELRFANDENGVMEYLVEWGVIPHTNRSFYHLYVDGIKKDDTLYVCHPFDKAYCFGTHNECSLGRHKPKSVQITDGLVLIHKMVESHYTKEIMDICKKDGQKHSDKCFREVQVLINSRGDILFQSDDKYDINCYYDIISDRLFSTHKSHEVTKYYRIDEHRLVPIFEGYEITKSNNCVYGNPTKQLGNYRENNFGKDTSVVYSINKHSLEIKLDV